MPERPRSVSAASCFGPTHCSRPSDPASWVLLGVYRAAPSFHSMLPPLPRADCAVSPPVALVFFFPSAHRQEYVYEHVYIFS